MERWTLGYAFEVYESNLLPGPYADYLHLETYGPVLEPPGTKAAEAPKVRVEQERERNQYPE
ncbi:hypothetical protein [Bradyrhizobium arachidis]|uniref:hypothetical protein n=1 Tax=Bradyrhizobium arachidis TaxID=858423 RepID=UPI002163AF04|nr:hypothetical protein [Bradyrhizobium arachidis]UVO30249.1 hypothetical protein KUF59_05710 [Bradyrhizobium arachidis]